MQREQEGLWYAKNIKVDVYGLEHLLMASSLLSTRAILLPTLVELLASSGGISGNNQFEERLEKVG